MARGLFAELQHQARVAAREQTRAERAAEQEYKAAVREAERTRKADERAAKQLARAVEAERKQFAKEAREAHIAAMQAEVESRNLEVREIYQEIDSLLAATLDVDDYVDLETLRVEAEHPPFDRVDLETPTPPILPIPDPRKPKLSRVTPPTGLGRLFGGKKHARAVARATADHEDAMVAWDAEVLQTALRRAEAENEHARLEAERLAGLDRERARYAAECATREAESAERNAAVEELITNLGYGTADAVQEYVSIVLSNSVYPSHFLVAHDFAFDAETAELRLRVLVPGPDKVTTVKTYKYTKSSDEITSVSLSQKACKDRYAGAVHQVALRTLHEVFEADRRGIIMTITLEVGTETIDPATGRETYLPFVATGASRDTFLEINLSSVVPAATLAHLGAAVSKNPFGFLAAEVTGIRRS